MCSECVSPDERSNINCSGELEIVSGIMCSAIYQSVDLPAIIDSVLVECLIHYQGLT